MKRKLIPIALAALVTAALAGRIQNTSWQALLTKETRLICLMPVFIEQYSGFNQGIVSGTFGTESELTAPLLHFRIVEGRLELSDGFEHTEYLSVLLRYGNVLIIKRSPGVITIFRVEHPGS